MQIFSIVSHRKHAKPIATHSILVSHSNYVVLPSTINYIPQFQAFTSEWFPDVSIPLKLYYPALMLFHITHIDVEIFFFF